MCDCGVSGCEVVTGGAIEGRSVGEEVRMGDSAFDSSCVGVIPSKLSV